MGGVCPSEDTPAARRIDTPSTAAEAEAGAGVAKARTSKGRPGGRGRNPSSMKFVHTARSVDGSGQFVGIDSDGVAHTWGRTNGLGQLGRSGRANRPAPIALAPPPEESSGATTPDAVRAVRGFASGISESGHTAVLDSDGALWLTGCDRWQQLGLGSSDAGAAGYAWKDGVWQERFRRNDYLRDLMRRRSSGGDGDDERGGGRIRDVALGADHTVVLAANGRDVYTFGKGGEGQLGLPGRPFVSAPARSRVLSLPSLSNGRDGLIAAVCAMRHCSVTLDSNRDILRKAGKCKMEAGGMAEALKACRDRAERDGLISNERR